MSWQGIFPSIPTAFTPDGEVDLAAQRDVVRFVIAAGAHGMICFGLAGEVLRLTPEERMGLCDVIVEEANGVVPVLVGVGAESEYVSRRLAQYAERAGANGVVLPPPLVGGLTEELLQQFFLRVVDSVGLPVMIQDAKEYLGVGVGPHLVRSVAAVAPHVTSVKLETGADHLPMWLRELPETISIFGGNAGLYLLDCVRVGAAGVAPGVEVTDVLVAIYASEIAGDSANAERLLRELLPLLVFELQDLDHFNLCVKHILSRRGVSLHTGLRQPAPSLAPEAVLMLDAYLDALALGDLETAMTPDG